MAKTPKDLTLLRAALGSPFLPSEQYCTKAGVLIGFVGFTRASDMGCFRYITGDYTGNYDLFELADVKHAPLFWLAGRPIYRGDMLCSPHRNPFMVGGIDNMSGHVFPLGEPNTWIHLDTVSYLPPPKIVERWIVVTANCKEVTRCASKNDAEFLRARSPGRVVGIFPITEPE